MNKVILQMYLQNLPTGSRNNHHEETFDRSAPETPTSKSRTRGPKVTTPDCSMDPSTRVSYSARRCTCVFKVQPGERDIKKGDSPNLCLIYSSMQILFMSQIVYLVGELVSYSFSLSLLS